jgi:hypothetical protein
MLTKKVNMDSLRSMEEVSFRRKAKLMTSWKNIPGELSSWEKVFFPESAEDDCIWWQVCELSPKISLSGNWKLISIETHPQFGFDNYRSDDKSSFNVGLVTDGELQILTGYLNEGNLTG